MKAWPLSWKKWWIGVHALAPLVLLGQPVYQNTFHHGAASYFVSSRGSQLTAVGNAGYLLSGEFRDSVDFDPGTGADLRVATDQEDIFLQRYDLQNQLRWTRTLPGVGREACPGHHVAVDGSIYLSGSFYGTVDFDPGPGTASYSFVGAPPYQADGYGASLYLLKLDSLGDFQWVHAFGDGTSFGGLRAVDTDAQGNVYTTASVHERSGGIPLFDMDPTAGVDWINHAGKSGIVQKFDAAGNYLWGRVIQGYANSQPGSPDVSPEVLAIDHAGMVVSAGYFSGNIDFDPGAGNAMHGSVGGYDLYLSKLNGNGQLVWAKTFGRPGSELHAFTGLRIDAQDNLYLIGYTRDSLDLDPGAGVAYAVGDSATCAFLTKYDPSGNLIYLKTWKGNWGFNLGDLEVNANGEVYLSGSNFGTTDLDPGAGTLSMTALSADVALIKLDALGDLDWAVQVGDSSWDVGAGIALVGSQDLFASGNFVQTVDFDPGAGTDTCIATSGSHTFVTHYGVSSSTAVAPAQCCGGIAIFPNPASSSVQLVWEDANQAPKQVRWLDQRGQAISLPQTQVGNTIRFDIAGLPAGLYYINAWHGNTRMAYKVAVVH